MPTICEQPGTSADLCYIRECLLRRPRKIADITTGETVLAGEAEPDVLDEV